MSAPHRPPRAVLWDVDVTMIDSSEYHWLSWRETLAAEGFALTRGQFTAVFGRRNDEILRGYFGEDYPPAEVARVGDAKERLYRELVRERGISLLPGVGRWLARLKAGAWLQAMASSAPRANLEAIAEALDLRGYFDAVVSAEDVTRGKPDPEVFLVAARKAGVPPRRAVVFEDAPFGIQAAKAAGMHAVGVTTTQPAAVLRAAGADEVVDRLAAYDVPGLLRRLSGS